MNQFSYPEEDIAVEEPKEKDTLWKVGTKLRIYWGEIRGIPDLVEILEVLDIDEGVIQKSDGTRVVLNFYNIIPVSKNQDRVDDLPHYICSG